MTLDKLIYWYLNKDLCYGIVQNGFQLEKNSKKLNNNWIIPIELIPNNSIIHIKNISEKLLDLTNPVWQTKKYSNEELNIINSIMIKILRAYTNKKNYKI